MNANTVFPDAKPFPTAAGIPATGGMGHNKPPLGEQIVSDFLESLRDVDGVDLIKRLEDLEAKEEKLGPVNDADSAGRYADFIKMCSAATKAVEAERMRHNRPLLDAQTALKGKGDALCEKVANATRKAKNELDRFLDEERATAAEAQRLANAEAARITREHEERARAQAEAGIPVEVAPVVKVTAAKVAPAKVVGDLGAKAVATTSWKHELLSVRQLPDSILKHAKVIEAIDKVIAQQVKGGVREMKGTRIFSTTSTTIR